MVIIYAFMYVLIYRRYTVYFLINANVSRCVQEVDYIYIIFVIKFILKQLHNIKTKINRIFHKTTLYNIHINNKVKYK